MSIRYLDENGAVNFWTNIKNFVLSKIPTKTSELANDSGYLTQHQSLSNYVTLNSSQTITGIKTITGGNQGKMVFKNPNFTVGTTPEATTTVTRIYFGGGASYDGSTGVITNDITSDGNSQLEICALNNNSSSSYRASLILRYEQDQTRPRFIKSWGDFCPYSNNTYYLGRSDSAWKDAYINNVHGISDYTNFLVKVLNFTTTLTHAVSGRRTVVCEGAITLTIPAPEEGSWFQIKATTERVLLNFANGVSVSGVDGIPITLKPNESILLCYYTASSYVAFCNFKRCGVIGRTGTAPSEPKNWFKVAECTLTETYIDPFICLRVFESTTGNTIGTLCAHCRINNTVGVVDTSNCYLQWQDAGAGIDLSKYALTTNETSGTGVIITIWCTLVGGYSSLRFEVVTECKRNDYPNNNTWKITRDRQTDGDLAELSNTDFTKIVYSTLTTLKNDTTGNAKNVTGTVAIANGGTGATSRLSAIKNLTNESVGTPTHFLGLTTNYAKCGYTSIAQAKTVLGITGDIGSHSDSEYVHKTGDESISGAKTFGNGTLIVDNGTGSNVHGEIKLNGTRPVYINADNAEDGLFANTSCGMSILLNDSSKSIHIGGITTGNNGRKIIKTSEKVPYLTLGTNEVMTKILVPENDTADSAFSITSRLDYASGASAKSFTVKFKQGDDGSSGVFPVANNKTDLGLSGNRWKNVYATNYYYGSGNTEFSTKFVTSDTAQTISGAKTFSSTITGDISGNASTATEFSANKDVTLTGDVTGTASSKAGWSVSTTLSNSGVTAGTYGPSEDVTGNNNATISVPEITVDSKGRVTSVTNRTLTCKNNTYNVYNKTLTIQKNGTNVATFTSNSNTNVTANITVPTKTSELTNDSNFLTTSSSLNASKLTGTIDIARLPQGALERVITVADQTARFALTTSSVQLGDTVKQLDTSVMYVVVNESKLNSNDGYLEYTAGSASSVPWSGITSKPTEFTPSSHTHTKSEITNFPTNVSAFTNDSGYLTSHQSLSNYVTLDTQQTVTGQKIFSVTPYIYNPDSTANTPCIYLRNSKVTKGGSDTGSQSIIFTDKNNLSLSKIFTDNPSNGTTSLNLRVSTLDSNNADVSAEVYLYVAKNGTKVISPATDGDISLGRSNFKWSTIYANNYYLGSTAFGDIVTHNASEFLTQHPSITLSTNTTSTASPAHGGTFTCIDSVTQDTNGHITKVNTKTVTLPSDSNTDTLMTQNVSTTDNTYPILLCATANATSNQGAKTGIFGSGVKVNPKTSVVSAKGFSGIPTGNTYVSAVKDGGALVNSQATAWGAIWRAPTKDYQVAGATWSSTNNNVYICYSVTNTNAEAGTNTMAKSLIWAADTGTLTTTTFSGVLSGNASSATEFKDSKYVTLTGDVTGTASSKAGWSVATTLANSGVTAGTYGPSADVTGSNNATILVPEITVDAKGRVTAVTNRTYTSVNTDSDKKVYQYYKSDDNVYRLLFSNNAGNTATSNVGAAYSGLNNSLYVNPSTGALYATKLYSNGVEVLTAHQSLSNYVTLNTAQEITNTKTFKDANTVVKRTDIEAGNTLPSADKLARNIFQDKNGKELGSIYYYKNPSGNTGLCLRAGDWFSESEGVYSLNASGTNRRAELVLYTNSSGDCCIRPNGLFSAHLKPLNSSICLAEYGKPFGVAYVNQVIFTNATLQVDVDIAATEEHSIGFFGKNNGPLSYITFQKRPSFKDRVAIRIQTASSSYKSYDFDATCFYPESSNSVDIGSTTNIFKNIYCNNYYKGTTAFGDIVTHNASEFLTSHQSLSSCVKNVVTNNQTIKSTGITRGTAPSSTQTFGIGFSDNNNKYIGNVYGQYATDKSTYVGLYAYKGSTTTNGDNVSVRVGYDASGNAYTYAPTPATADNSTQIATTAFVKAQGYLTAHQSLANYVTTNTDQSISGIKSHSKHISILGDYVGNESSTNGRSCLYLKANRDTDGKSGLYVTKFRQNVAQGSMGNSDVVFLSHDILENETRTNAGFVESYSNWEDDVPKGISVYSTIATRNLGTSAKPWTNAYITNLNLNGNAFDPTSTDGVGTVKLLAYAPTSDQEYSLNAGTTKAGSKLGEVWASYNGTMSTELHWGISMSKTQSGTWKLLHYISVAGGTDNLKLIGLWVRIS